MSIGTGQKIVAFMWTTADTVGDAMSLLGCRQRMEGKMRETQIALVWHWPQRSPAEVNQKDR